ncbi:nuclear pore complex protein Nup88 [Chrysoperla carnea]|uniref:nuclear pore complex protein Nup88 n=1 Tax=Chrysoperla carnea TaxID=189513 RepID=UPI001D07711E|nr:nuclear pore complex protein Nup88 [Chrysoperla carnea]
MASSTDILRLNDHKITKTIKNSLSKSIKNSKNVITVQDDVLFVWNPEDCCILTLNLKLLRSKSVEEVHYQTLLPTQPISFEVELIRVNTVVSYAALAGPSGVCVLELPRRGGIYAAFGNGKDIVYCRNYFLDERLFSCSKFVECKQVKWHPGSPSDNHLLVLTSENLIRTYKMENNGPVNERVWTVGKKPAGTMGTSKVPILVALGETGVDFDFGPPKIPKNNTKYTLPNKTVGYLEWPIYILRGNGDIYTITTEFSNDRLDDTILCGPLRMHPAADDNYGVDACAIICLQSNPPILAISTCTGTIYHAVILTENDDIVTEWKSEESRLPDKSLYVFECIELELGLSLNDVDLGHTCPIFFHHDEVNKMRYFCTHDTGIHTITVPLIGELDQLCNVPNDNFDNDMPSMLESSTAEYILCTHTVGATDINPVLGIAMLYNPGTLIALLGSGQFLSLPLVSVLLPLVQSEDTNVNGDTIISPTKKILKQPFDEYIKTFLKPTLTQPILKLAEKSISEPKENLELLVRATQTFREEHFKKLERVREEIEKRVKALQMLRKYQEGELSRLEQEKEKTQAFAEKLAEKYEDIKDKQELLTKRSEDLLRLVNQKQPIQTKAEKELAKQLKQDLEKLKFFMKMFDQIRNKQKYQAEKIREWRNQQSTNSKHLGKIQTNTIKSTLEMTTKQIAEMTKDILICKQDLGLH